MSPVQPRTPLQTLPGVSFGSLNDYAGGGALPEGNYCLYFDVRLHQAVDKNTGAARGDVGLGVMLTAYDLSDPTADPKEKFISMGRKAKLTYMPDATGKGLALVPGGPAGSLNNKTNWFYLLKSLYDCAMPEGTFVNDLTAIDGIHVHIQNVPEPEERKSYGKGAATGEPVEGGDERMGSGLMPIVTEILESGRPWEGTGGVPEAAVPAAPVAPARPGPKPVAARPAPVAAAPAKAPAAPRAPARPAPVAAAPVVEESDSQDVALQAIGDVLSRDTLKNACPKMTLRTEAFKWMKANFGESTAQAAMSTQFANDAALSALLTTVGYTMVGSLVQPA